MVTVAEFVVRTADFPFSAALSLDSTTRIELERIVPVADRRLSSVWVRGRDTQEILERIRSDPAVGEVEYVETVQGRSLFRFRWSEDPPDVLECLRACDAVLLTGVANTDWNLQIRFPSHESLQQFYELCTDADHPVELMSTASFSDWWDPPQSLSPQQREALRLAMDQGYFDVPRQTNLAELSDRLDISDQAVSERLRRGVKTLLADNLGPNSHLDRQKKEH